MKSSSLAVLTVLMCSCVAAMFATTHGPIPKGNNSHGDIAQMVLVAQYKPLHLEIYAYTNSSDTDSDFQIVERGRLLFSRDHEPSNIVSISHADKGMDVRTEFDTSGRILRRYFHSNYTNDIYRMKYSYVDTNGDGMFQYLIAYKESGSATAAFVLSNNCWVAMPLPDRSN